MGKQKNRNGFNDLSLYKKILLIVSVTFVFLYLFFFFSIHILTARYEKELYQTNAQILEHVSSSIVTELQSVETLSSNVLSDSSIQENLMLLQDDPNNDKNPIYRRNIYECLYPYIFRNGYIKSINVILNDGTNICMGNTSDIRQFDVELMNREADGANGRLVWLPSRTAGNNIAGARQIRQMKYLDLRKLASLYIVVDMEKLIQDSLGKAGYAPNQSNFVLLDEGQRIYPENSYHDERFGRLLSDMYQSGENYTITAIEGEKKFIIAGMVPYCGWEYLYFRDYNGIFYNIQTTKVSVFLFSVCVGIMALIVVQLIFRRILKHLDYLVEKIRCFGSGEPIPVDQSAYDYSGRRDEIGQLHVNFDEMTKSVKVLRDENYDKQLLLRDATIRMLRQQINPHFLYNTLDTINWMAQKSGAEEISVMVRSLGNLFRASITGQDDFVHLKDELEVLDNYIRIQKVRFKNRLDFQLVTSDELSQILVPKLCIQPLVENALKHAMEYTNETCIIRVTIQEREQEYTIRVANTGSRFEEDLLWKIENKQITPQGSGVGLVNINSRMKLLYGDNYGLNCYNKEGMAIVMLSIPKERGDGYAETDDCR